jgi:hypothetical protein
LEKEMELMGQAGMVDLLVLERNPLDNIASMLRRMLNELHSPRSDPKSRLLGLAVLAGKV